MAIVDYARVSSSGQSLTIQLDKLSEAGCTEIFQEKRSGLTA
jgi:DNA invertase Pin-like site-specific DNA recombinase